MAKHNRTIQFLGTRETELKARGSGSTDSGRLGPHGAVAQLVERLLCKQVVRSSSLLSSTNLIGPVAQLVRARA